jgi:drug/metabolite transporter (DMT)-like permease
MPDTGAFRRHASKTQIVLAFAAVYVLWGSTYLGIKFGVETLPPFLMAGLRHSIAGLLLYAWVRLSGTPAPEPKQWLPAAGIGALLLLGGNGLVSWAEQRVPSGLAALIVASVPIWLTLLYGLQKRARPHGVVLLGLGVGLAGLAFLVAPGRFAGGSHVDLAGAGALLSAALFWATGSLYARRAKLPSSTLLATAMEMLTGGAALLLTSGLLREWKGFSFADVSARSWLALAYLIVAGSLVGFTAYIFLLGATTPARVGTYAYVNPIVAVFFGWAFASEVVTARMVIAALGILGAVAVIIRYGGQKTQKEVATEAAPGTLPEPRRAGRSS